MTVSGRKEPDRQSETVDNTRGPASSRKVGWIRRGFESLSEITTGAGFAAIIDQMVASGTNLMTGIVVGRACSKDEFGLYMLGFSVVFTVLSLQTALISTPFTVFGARLDGRDLKRYTGSTLLHQFGVSLISVAGLIGFALFVTVSGVNPGLAKVLWTLVAVVSFILLKEFARRVCFANLEFRPALKIDVCVSLVQLIGLIVLAQTGLISAVTAVAMIGIAAGIPSIGWLVYWRGRLEVDWSRVVFDFKSNWSIGRWVFLSVLLWTIALNIYPWILAIFHGTASAGIWAACLGVVALGNPVLLVAENFIGPRLSHSFAEENVAGLKRTVTRMGLAFSIVMTPFSLVLVVFGGSIAVFFYGEKYAGYDMVISLLGLNLMVALIGIPLSRALFALERADLDFLVNFVPLIALLVVGLPLAQKLGPLGAGYGLLLGNVAGQAARAAVFARLSRSNETSIDP